MQKTYSVITTKLKKLREKNGYSQERIAEILNKSQSAYGKIELGKTELTFKDANEIANADKSLEPFCYLDFQCL